MPSSLAPEGHGLRLITSACTYIAGGRVTGTVQLDSMRAQAENFLRVRIALRGLATVAFVNESLREKKSTLCSANTPVIHRDVILWTYQGAYSEAPLDLPFSIDLPADLPPSFHARSGKNGGLMSYCLEVVAERHGMLHRDRRIAKVLTVLSRAQAEHVASADLLRQGVVKAWGSVAKTLRIRRWAWGERADVSTRFECPAVKSFPIGVPIPISLVITTTTKTVAKSEATSVVPGPSVFPPLPPVDAIRLRLHHEVHLTTNGSKCTIRRFVPLRTCSGAGAPEPARVSRMEPALLSSGRWRRELRLDTHIVLRCPPTMDAGTIRTAKHCLMLGIPFPGLGNNLNLNISIHVNTGVGTSTLAP